ncbi:hypothetical protein, partial [Bartonella capreoli]|uniref:hypothetical protein n=1 Tax=Bartonella capreoli TaxID=155192 RepID=UPI001ABC351E
NNNRLNRKSGIPKAADVNIGVLGIAEKTVAAPMLVGISTIVMLIIRITIAAKWREGKTLFFKASIIRGITPKLIGQARNAVSIAMDRVSQPFP